MTKRKKRLIWTIILALLLVYVGSYVILSRRGFREADKGGYSGFYLLTLENSTAWELKNYGLVLLYYPLILIDVMLGTGRMPAMTEPMYEIDVSGY
ncbi:MAG: hypothetical protein HQ559_10470 [Lentisphaerae bacterium]|nr:hypothetical protein [Lentisphaerota bacterium]